MKNFHRYVFNKASGVKDPTGFTADQYFCTHVNCWRYSAQPNCVTQQKTSTTWFIWQIPNVIFHQNLLLFFLLNETVIHYRTEWKWSNCSHWKDFCTCWIGFYWSSLKQMFIYTSREFIFLGWMKIETSWSREWRKSAFHGNHNWEEFDNSSE